MKACTFQRGIAWAQVDQAGLVLGRHAEQLDAVKELASGGKRDRRVSTESTLLLLRKRNCIYFRVISLGKDVLITQDSVSVDIFIQEKSKATI